MDFPWKILLFSILTLSGCVTVNGSTPDLNRTLEDPTTFGTIGCVLNGTILRVTIGVFKNGSNINGAEFYERGTGNGITSGDCLFTGAGSDESPFRSDLQIDVTTDLPPSGRNNCGHSVEYDSDGNKTYVWPVHAFVFQGSHIVYGDSFWNFKCTAEELSTSAVFNVDISLAGLDRDLTTGFGVITMGILPDTPGQTFVLGDLFQVKLEFVPSAFNDSDGTSASLRPWGVYCVDFYATPSLTSNRRVPLQDSQGCPIPNQPLSPEVNFQQDTGTVKFISTTGNITAVRFDKTASDPLLEQADRVYFVCVAEICFRQSDEKCKERCQSSSGRRKRQALDERYTVVTYIDIVNPNSDTGITRTEQKSEALSLGYVIGLAAGGGLILVASLVLLFCLCRLHSRKEEKYRRQSNTSSSASTKPSYKTSSAASRMPNREYRY